MNVDECFEQKLLRKISVDSDKVEKSLEASKKFFNDAKLLHSQKLFYLVIIAAYTSMFHAARAVLYSEGIQEKSHYAVFIYLKEKHFSSLGDAVFEYNAAREQRREGIYGLEYEFNEEDSNHLLAAAEKFNSKIKLILKK
ncbi:MAG: HEPN domain-containing protein [Candidatus Nanoarchaeia archaeon]